MKDPPGTRMTDPQATKMTDPPGTKMKNPVADLPERIVTATDLKETGKKNGDGKKDPKRFTATTETGTEVVNARPLSKAVRVNECPLTREAKLKNGQQITKTVRQKKLKNLSQTAKETLTRRCNVKNRKKLSSHPAVWKKTPGKIQSAKVVKVMRAKDGSDSKNERNEHLKRNKKLLSGKIIVTAVGI